LTDMIFDGVKIKNGKIRDLEIIGNIFENKELLEK